MKAADIPNECIEEPRFVKVLAASLCSEIAETKIALNETNAEVEEIKGSVMKGWEKRKTLKLSIEDLSQQKQVLNAALESLVRETKSRSIEIAIVKNRLDDATLRDIDKCDGVKKIIQKYQDTWKRYEDDYEKLPLAMKRKECRADVKRVTVQHMITDHKMKELIKMIKQREMIFSLQIKAAIVDFSKMILQRWKDDEYFENLKSITTELEEKLNTYTSQVQREIDHKIQDESEDATKMPPPRLHFPFMCSIIYPNADEKAMSRQQRSRNLPSDDIDATSVNTLMLEEMCTDDDYHINEDSGKMDKVLVKGGISNVSSTAMRQYDSNFQSAEDSRYSVERRKSVPIIMDQSTDNIRDKLESLDIEKRNIARYGKEFSKQSNSPKKNSYNKNNDGHEENKNNDDIQQDSTLQRTIERFEEQTKVISPTESESSGVSRSGIIYESIEKEKREQRRGDKRGENVGIINEDRRYKEPPEHEKHLEKIGQPKTSSRPIVLARHTKTHKPEPEIPERLRPTLTPSSTNVSSIHGNMYELSQLMADNENDDSSFREIPKIRRIDTVDYSKEFLKSMQKRAPQGDSKSHVKRNLSPPSRSYISSCISSENILSNIADWPKIPRGIFPEEVGIATDFSPLQNWDNWSPSRRLSEMSFSPSSFISRSQNNDCPENQREVGAKRNLPAEKPTDNSQINMFFKPTIQNPRTSFL